MRDKEGKRDTEEHKGVEEEEGRGIQRKQRTIWSCTYLLFHRHKSDLQ